jgi:CRISPR-associated DxTHG motif protein
MTRKVFISFLGMGNPNNNPPYDKVKYCWNNNTTENEKIFVQSAILELHDNEFDKIIILSTKSSSANISKFKDEISTLNIDEGIFDTSINDISDDLFDLNGEKGAWNWFERLNGKIELGDKIFLDVTHGFRIVPVVFSAALSYLKRAKNIDILGVLYGAYVPPKKDAPKKESYPIVDVKDFYSISDWAEGVGRLVDDADASFLRKVAEREHSGGFVGLNNVDLLDNVEKLTKSVRNVELQNIENNAKIALDAIQQSMKTAQSLEKQILEMILEKFTPLISEPPADSKYSKEYLMLQIKLINLLATHQLYMQCFTAMREWLGSLGLAILNKFSYNQSKKEGNKDEQARSYAEVFVAMLQYKPDKWNFPDEKKKKKSGELLPAYNALKKSLPDFENSVVSLLVKMNEVRNGFDHGWTGKHKEGIPNDINDIFQNAHTTFLSIIDNWDSIISTFHS